MPMAALGPLEDEPLIKNLKKKSDKMLDALMRAKEETARLSLQKQTDPDQNKVRALIALRAQIDVLMAMVLTDQPEYEMVTHAVNAVLAIRRIFSEEKSIEIANYAMQDVLQTLLAKPPFEEEYKQMRLDDLAREICASVKFGTDRIYINLGYGIESHCATIDQLHGYMIGVRRERDRIKAIEEASNPPSKKSKR